MVLPQLSIRDWLVGGIDKVRQLPEAGELQRLLEGVGGTFVCRWGSSGRRRWEAREAVVWWGDQLRAEGDQLIVRGFVALDTEVQHGVQVREGRGDVGVWP